MSDKITRFTEDMTLRDLLRPLSAKAQPLTMSWGSAPVCSSLAADLDVDARARMGLASKAGKIIAKARKAKQAP